MSDIVTVINLAYVVAAALFILGLKLLSHTATAKNGNLISAIGMLVAFVVTLLDTQIISYHYILLGFAIGGAFGAGHTMTVQLTAITEQVQFIDV